MTDDNDSTKSAWSLSAPAKVNLVLRVVGKRADGYHELETVFHAIDFDDTLTLRVRPELPGVAQLLLRDGAGSGLPVVAGEDNLVVRAARAFIAASGITVGLQFRLDKRVPAGGGLGGGSSDAAAALRLLNEVAASRAGATELSAATLHGIAVALGADVPFFLRGETQLGTGIGTDLRPLPLPSDLWFLLVLPPFGTSTARVYENYEPHWIDERPITSIGSTETGLAPESSWTADMLEHADTLAKAVGLANDLEPAAMRAYPELAELRQAVAAAGFDGDRLPSVHLSGSGSSMFVAFSEEREMLAAEPVLRAVCSQQALGSHGARVVRARSARHASPRRVSWPDDSDSARTTPPD